MKTQAPIRWIAIGAAALSLLSARSLLADDPTGGKINVFDFSAPNTTPVSLTQPGIPRIDPLLDPHCYEGVEVF